MKYQYRSTLLVTQVIDVLRIQFHLAQIFDTENIDGNVKILPFKFFPAAAICKLCKANLCQKLTHRIFPKLSSSKFCTVNFCAIVQCF